VNIWFKLLTKKEQERAFGSNPTGPDNYGDKTGYNKRERAVIMMGQAATLTEKKSIEISI
jgi:hypothetical protein